MDDFEIDELDSTVPARAYLKTLDGRKCYCDRFAPWGLWQKIKVWNIEDNKPFTILVKDLVPLHLSEEEKDAINARLNVQREEQIQASESPEKDEPGKERKMHLEIPRTVGMLNHGIDIIESRNREGGDLRRLQIESFLTLPKSWIERGWMRERLLMIEQSLVSELDSWEDYGTRNYLRASEDDPYVDEAEFYDDYNETLASIGKNNTLYADLTRAFSWEDTFHGNGACEVVLDETATEGAASYMRLICRILRNNLELLDSGEVRIEQARRKLAEATKDYEAFESDPDDRIKDCLYEWRNEMLSAKGMYDYISAIVPTAWPNVSEFSHIREIQFILDIDEVLSKKVERLRELAEHPAFTVYKRHLDLGGETGESGSCVKVRPSIGGGVSNLDTDDFSLDWLDDIP